MSGDRNDKRDGRRGIELVYPVGILITPSVECFVGGEMTYETKFGETTATFDSVIHVFSIRRDVTVFLVTVPGISILTVSDSAYCAHDPV